MPAGEGARPRPSDLHSRTQTGYRWTEVDAVKGPGRRGDHEFRPGGLRDEKAQFGLWQKAPRTNTVIRIVAGLLLIAYGLVHLLYLTPEADNATYPFTLRVSWLVPETARRPVAIVLIAATIVVFALIGLAVWGVPGLSGAWPTFTILAASISLALLIAFWDARLIVGVVIDVALIVVALKRAGWTDAL